LFIVKDRVSDAVLERLRGLWEWRKAVDTAGDEDRYSEVSAAELQVLGVWFASAKFDAAWSLRELEEVLQYTNGQVTDSILVVERLAELASELPIQAVKCLDLMLQGTHEVWTVHGWQESALLLLGIADQSSDATAMQASQQLRSRFVARGFWAYKE
jgi:hypothetical protein